ncbi:glycosyl transferase family 36 [Candidatus Sumerlaeota bacterium]|nr:glycosyl transferase family 36 [Candidatus Sumerlaeota bacterium]
MCNFLSNKYGYFDQKALEFVLTKPDTPLPWVNYMTYKNLSGLISHTGGGFSFYLSPRNGRITRWRYNSLPVDRPGRYIYLRDRKSGQYWSITWQPTPNLPFVFYECRHGMNYTTISYKIFGIRTEITFFISSDDVEIWWARLFEEDGKPRVFDVYSYMELCLGHALTDLINQPNDKHFNDVHFLKDSRILMATKRYWVTYNSATVKQANRSWNKWAFVGSSLPVEGFDGSKDQFIGPWRSEENPLAIEKGVSMNTEITAGDAIASLRCPLEIPSFGKAEFCFFMGAVDKTGDEPEHTAHAEKNAVEISKKYRNLQTIHKEFKSLLERRDDYLSSCHIDVPDQEMGVMVNFWNQYQSKTTFQFTRDASYHHGGLLFGRGYRDSCQDAMGPLITSPEWVRERIREMAARQFQDGSVYHCYYPDSGGGERTGHSDTPLWLPMIVTAYLKETGDTAILGESAPFEDGGEADIRDHLFRAVDFLSEKTNDRNLILIGPGDWNDTLDYCGRHGRGVSSMNTFIYAFILREMADLLNRLKHPKADEYRGLYETIKKAANQYLWDGEWYIRAINDMGEKIGSRDCEEGRIFLNAQSWAVISGVADAERAEKAMASAAKHCSTQKGPKILHPAYTKVNQNIGLATRCVPGKKENGAIFNHAASWAILADLILKHADRAYLYYRQTLPMNPVVDIDRYEIEPYAYAEYVTSPDHPTFGQASHSWLTGSSVWMLRNVIDYLLGVRPDYDGLLIDPCIPSDWKKYKVLRRFRDAMYEISFENPQGGTGKIKSITMDGKNIKGNILPEKRDKSTHNVSVILG